MKNFTIICISALLFGSCGNLSPKQPTKNDTSPTMEEEIKDPSTEGVSGLKGVNTSISDSEFKKKYAYLGIGDSLEERVFHENNKKLAPQSRVLKNVEGLGESMFDYNITSLSQLEDLNNTRRELQPWYAQLAAGIAKAGVLAATTFVGSAFNTTQRTTEIEVKEKSADYYRSKGYQVFEHFGFAVKAPVRLEDVSQQASGDFLLNLGGIENPDNEANGVAYQIIVTRLPVGYRNASPNDFEKIDEKMLELAKDFESSKKMKFGYESYPGVEVTGKAPNGMKLKGVIFRKDNYFISCCVMTHYNLTKKFNRFTNQIKFIHE